MKWNFSNQSKDKKKPPKLSKHDKKRAERFYSPEEEAERDRLFNMKLFWEEFLGLLEEGEFEKEENAIQPHHVGGSAASKAANTNGHQGVYHYRARIQRWK
jgi:hypothetical protein